MSSLRSRRLLGGVMMGLEPCQARAGGVRASAGAAPSLRLAAATSRLARQAVKWSWTPDEMRSLELDANSNPGDGMSQSCFLVALLR
jgi:hypothetical protein